MFIDIYVICKLAKFQKKISIINVINCLLLVFNNLLLYIPTHTHIYIYEEDSITSSVL